MLQILQQPFPSQKNTRHTLRMCIIASACVWAVFFFIKPFGLEEMTDAAAAATGLKFALVTLVLSLFCTAVLPFLFPAWFDEKHWTVFMEMIFLLTMVLIIAVGNIWLTTWLFGNPLSAALVVSTVKYTLVIGAGPVLLSVILNQQRLLAKYSREARQIEENMAAASPPAAVMPVHEAGSGSMAGALDSTGQALAAVPPQVMPGQSATPEPAAAEILQPSARVQPLQLKGDNQSENLALPAADFLFAAAADNYTNIYYLHNGLLQQVLFRVSVKSLEEQASGIHGIFRCHKSFLVNLRQVAHISGNAQGYKLHLHQNEFTVPVSRSLNGRVKQLLQELHPKK